MLNKMGTCYSRFFNKDKSNSENLIPNTQRNFPLTHICTNYDFACTYCEKVTCRECDYRNEFGQCFDCHIRGIYP